MYKQALAFGIGVAIGLGYALYNNQLHDAATTRHVAVTNMPMAHMQQRQQWLQQLRHHTSFSFLRQLLQPPAKIEYARHKPAAATTTTADKNKHLLINDSQINPPNPISDKHLLTDNLVQALQQALGKSAPATIKQLQPTTPLPFSTGSPWAIQVATRSSYALAQQLRQQLVAKGHDARVLQGVNPHTDELEYYVRLHGFATQQQAQKYRKQKLQTLGRGLAPFCLQQSVVR
ncbi:MAG: SPOR domain-containing protein [Myxococcota bacterium]